MFMQAPANQVAGNRFFDCILIALAGYGPDNSAIRFPGIEGSAGQDRRRAPQGGDCIFFVGVPYFVSNPGAYSREQF